MADAHRHLLGIVSLVLLLVCLPWTALAFFGLFGVFNYDADGICRAGRPLWALGQAVVAVIGVVIAGKAGFGGLTTAVQNRQDARQRWLWIVYALLALGTWLVVIFVLEPEGEPLPPARCA